MSGIILCLCDRTGVFAEPWTTFGYTAILVDPQHADFGEKHILKIPATLEEAMPLLGIVLATHKVEFVVGWPPCTDVAVSGAAWWEEKRICDPYFQAKAAIVAEQCRTIGQLAGCPWIFENPVSAFSNIFGKPDYTFDPIDYAGYSEEDTYTKKTCLWAGGGFVMPPAQPRGSAGSPDNRINLCSPGPDRANFRAQTPRGFSIACFLYNCKKLRHE